MSSLHDSDAHELLEGYLDGELDADAERRLFGLLAGDDSLRRRLRDLQAIRVAARGYAYSLTPPAASTAAVFTQLGFAVPVSPAGAGASAAASGAGSAAGTSSGASAAGDASQTALHTTSWLSGLFSSMHGLRTALIVAGASSVLTGTAVYFAMNGSGNDAGSNSNAPQVQTAQNSETPSPTQTAASPITTQQPASATPQPASAAPQTASAAPQTASAAPQTASAAPQTASAAPQTASAAPQTASAAPQPASAAPQPASAAPQPAADRKGRMGETTDNQVPTSDNGSAAALAHLELPADARAIEMFAGRTPSVDTLETGMQHPMLGAMVLAHGPWRLALEYGAFMRSNSPGTAVPARSQPVFDRMHIALLWQAGAATWLGIDAGQEAFPQRYDGTENGRHVTWEQQLLTPWALAVWRQELPSLRLTDELTPYTSLAAGATREWWPLTRIEAGLLWRPVPSAALRAGVDAGALAYRFQNRWFTTRQIGVTYGIVLQF